MPEPTLDPSLSPTDSPSLEPALEPILRRRLRDEGALGFDEWMEAALYHPRLGFFTAHGQAGKRGRDFLTSPEVGPLFGAVLARAVDAAWRRLGCPAEFTLVEAGAGTGTLARDILRAEPACHAGGCLRYVMVERSPKLRAAHRELLSERVFSVGGLGVADADIDADTDSDTNTDWRWDGGAGMILANELLDNLPFKILEQTETENDSNGGWREVVYQLDEVSEAEGQNGSDLQIVEQLCEVDGETQRCAAELAPNAEVGSRIPWQTQAADWVSRALDLFDRGQLIVFDYGGTTAELAGRDGWLRTYRQHRRGSDPRQHLGRQDITADVAFDQLPTGAELQTQGDFLRRWGIDDLVEEGQQIWKEEAANPTTQTLIAGSRMAEAAVLCDPEAHGAYWVASWEIG